MVKQHLGKERKLPIDRVFISDGCQNICVGSSNVFDTVVATRKKTSESDQLSVPFRLSKTEIPKTFAFQTDVK